LSWWKLVNWKLEEHAVNFDVLANNTRRIVLDMIAGHVNGVPNVYLGWRESKVRFLSAGRYLSAAIPPMRRNNYGKIINLSSTTILTGLSHRLHYVTAKGAIAP
jgi:NAD(P)-dependent dehydrogenase (short-subunit alcohol dehydrogenase family)